MEMRKLFSSLFLAAGFVLVSGLSASRSSGSATDLTAEDRTANVDAEQVSEVGSELGEDTPATAEPGRIKKAAQWVGNATKYVGKKVWNGTCAAGRGIKGAPRACWNHKKISAAMLVAMVLAAVEWKSHPIAKTWTWLKSKLSRTSSEEDAQPGVTLPVVSASAEVL